MCHVSVLSETVDVEASMEGHCLYWCYMGFATATPLSETSGRSWVYLLSWEKWSWAQIIADSFPELAPQYILYPFFFFIRFQSIFILFNQHNVCVCGMKTNWPVFLIWPQCVWRWSILQTPSRAGPSVSRCRCNIYPCCWAARTASW